MCDGPCRLVSCLILCAVSTGTGMALPIFFAFYCCVMCSRASSTQLAVILMCRRALHIIYNIQAKYSLAVKREGEGIILKWCCIAKTRRRKKLSF
jgi:hypothetical protein